MDEAFYVDLGALDEAVTGVNDTLAMMASTKVSALSVGEGSVGHALLANELRTFSVRWGEGVNNLRKDIEAVIGDLQRSRDAYAATDEARAVGMSGVLRASQGSDPGAS